MSVTALQAAKFACEVSGWKLTNLQLQKILYLAHMVFSGRNHEPMIGESFQAWNYGPVLPSLYRRVSAFGAGPVKNVFSDTPNIENQSIKSVLKDAVNTFAEMPAFKLVELTHDSKSAWSRCYVDGIYSITIPQEYIENEYTRRFSRPTE